MMQIIYIYTFLDEQVLLIVNATRRCNAERYSRISYAKINYYDFTWLCTNFITV